MTQDPDHGFRHTPYPGRRPTSCGIDAARGSLASFGAAYTCAATAEDSFGAETVIGYFLQRAASSLRLWRWGTR